MSDLPREELLEAIVGIAPPDADVGLSRRNFLPTPAHRRALGLDIVVIRGARGAGKTALFKLASGFRDPDDLRAFFEDPRLPAARWVDAYSNALIEHPDVSVLETYAPHASDAGLRAFWMTHLLRRLLQTGAASVPVPEGMVGVWGAAVADLPAWLPSAEKHLGQVSAAIDAIEQSLASEGRHVFAAYDSLDLLGEFDHDVRRRYIRALLAMWLTFSTRYRHLRAKVFLREDLFDPVELGFVDASKLRARSESLDWNSEALYRLVVRYLANSGEACRALLRDVEGLTLVDRGADGWMPGPMPDAVQKAFMLALAPRTLGKGVLKGDTHVWIVSRLQDSELRITPRALLWFLSYAAESATKARRTKGPLLAASDMLDALRRTSRARAAEVQEEYQITKRMERLRGMSLPMVRAKALESLQKPMEGEGASRVATGELVLDELVRIGVLRALPDGRLDVPDVFRYYFEIGPDYAAAWKDFTEKEDPVAREYLMRDLSAAAGTLRDAGVTPYWPALNADIEAGRYDDALRKIEAKLHMAQEGANVPWEIDALMQRGRVQDYRGNYAGARRDFARAEELARKNGRASDQMVAQYWLGTIAAGEEQIDSARTWFERSLQGARSLKAALFENLDLCWLGRVARRSGDFEESRRRLLEARTIAIRAKVGGDAEARTFDELSDLVIDRASRDGADPPKDGKPRPPLTAVRLAVLAAVLDAKTWEAGARQTAEHGGLSHDEYEALLRELGATYAKDRGWSVIREAFPDLPEKDPATS
ncbi:MAG: hypothetical protein U0326_02990 [Polyangiales bacterium]